MTELIAPLLALTLVAAPAFAAPHAHQGHAPAESHKPKHIASRTLDEGKMSVTLLDARAYFDAMHQAHPGHPGIPTHQLLVKDLTGKSGAPLKGLKLVSTSGTKSDAPLRTEQGVQIADVELRKPGRYTFELLKHDGSVMRWQHRIR